MKPPTSKPVALVLDDQWKDPDTREAIREPYLQQWIGDLVDLQGISFYTLPSLRRKEIGEGRTPEQVALKKPKIIFLDLDVLKSGVWSDGIEYLNKTLQGHPELRGVPVVILSDFVDAARALIRRSGIDESRAFNWGRLVENTGGLQARFRTLVQELISETST